ncbi:MAG TPA: serine hydrolase domain-containing protein [Actinomycetota bacterium]|jgi:CubicO group peptidase (beta-lactamase class C family)|nr:serine hydrolase domain-containing protein [Actinomycetota bacterium]
MSGLAESLDRVAFDARFSGVVRVDRGNAIEFAAAYGFADRRHRIPNRMDTQFGIASGVKGLTALTVMTLVQEGRLELATTARSMLGRDLPLIDDSVTVEHLLTHRSGIGDYLDEEIERPITDHVMTVPPHELDSTEAYLKVLDGYPMKFQPGERFSYSNGGYVVLALIAGRVAGTPFHEVVERRVCQPAGMADTAFLRSDELPGRAATGYLDEDGLRTNVLHLPVRGSGDGGIYSTAADFSALWTSLFAGRIVATDLVAEMVRRHSDAPGHSGPYGLGFWLHESRELVELHGYDAGASFTSVHDPTRRLTFTVMSNTSEGAWPLVEMLHEALMA